MPPDVDVTARRRNVVIATVLTAAVLGVLDGLWLGVLSGDLYADRIGHLLADDQRAGPAVVFYLVYVLGLVWFVVRPGLARAGLGRSLGDAAAFGLVTYATFDLTSMAVLDGFPLSVVLVDLAWGVALCTATTAVVLTVMRALGPSDRLTS